MTTDSVTTKPASDNIAWLSPRTTRWLTPILLILGIELWLTLGQGNYGHQYKPLIVLIAIALGFVPPITRRVDRLWNALAHPSPIARASIALIIWITATLFLAWSERLQHISFQPKWEDEFSYLTQMQMLAHGHLWMPALPQPEFFQSFYLLVTPVYASMYFPGAAIMYLPALLLHFPYAAGPLAAAGLCTALLWLVFTEILDAPSAFLAVLLLLSLPLFRMMSIMLMAQTPTLLLGLAMTRAYLQWRKKMKPVWLFLLGFAAGWAAITRPADALCFAIVIGIAMAFDLKPKPASFWSRSLAMIALPVLPFLLFQLYLNHNITGDWFTTPFARYNEINYPNSFGFHSGPAPAHVSDIPELQTLYETWAKQPIEQHQLKNFISIGLKSQGEMLRRYAIADPFLWLIMPLSLPVLWNRKFWAVWGMLPVFILGLSPYAFSWTLPHYMMIVMPATILLAILPLQFLTTAFPNHTGSIRTIISFVLIALALAAMPQFNRLVHDLYFEPIELPQIDDDLATRVSPPAVVLFHFNRAALAKGTINPSEDPVFNPDVAWPDDATIIRARDLNEEISAAGKPGDLDRPLYEHYSRLNPARVFYIYNRGGSENRLRRLGTVSELLALTAPATQP